VIGAEEHHADLYLHAATVRGLERRLMFDILLKTPLVALGVRDRVDGGGVGSTFTPPPANENSGLRTYRLRSSGMRSSSEMNVARGTPGWSKKRQRPLSLRRPSSPRTRSGRLRIDLWRNDVAVEPLAL
jgi:hypothetical protein